MKKSLISLALLATVSSPVMADGLATYEITITNATSHQVLTPPLLVTHSDDFQLFAVGNPASDGLILQAETGNPSVLYSEVNAARGVQDAITGTAPIVYGQSASFTIHARKKGMLSLTTMLATTNDGFAALNAVELPKKSATYYALAYDAGSEMNNELCSHIPGPPCAADSGNARTESGEGFISIHNGVHGGGDLNPAEQDWRNPVAIITVTRIDD